MICVVQREQFLRHVRLTNNSIYDDIWQWHVRPTHRGRPGSSWRSSQRSRRLGGMDTNSASSQVWALAPYTQRWPA